MMQPSNSPPSVCMRLGAVLVLMIGFGTPLEAAPPDRPVDVNIEAQEIGPALMAFAAQTDLNVLFSAEIIGNHRTKAISGRYTPSQILDILLEGSNLVYRFEDDDTASIGPRNDGNHQRGAETNSGGNALEPEPANSPGPEESSADERIRLDQVIVTASKRDQFLQDVAFSITALTGSALEALGADDFAGYAYTVPGLAYQDGGPSRRSYSIRGIGAQLAGVSTVGVYLNDIPISDDRFNPDLKVFDIERIEVLRGPQGTLYGEGSMGGTIRLITNKPDAGAFEAKVHLEGATVKSGSEDFSASGMINVPIARDRAALRTVVYYRDLAGWIDNVQLGLNNVNDEQTLGARGSLLVHLAENTRATATIIYQDSEFGGRNIETPGAGDLIQVRFVEEPMNDEYVTYNFTFEHAFESLDFVSSTSYFDRDFDAVDDITFNNGIFPDLFTVIDFERKIFTQEARVTSDFSGAFQFLAGFYYTDRDERGAGLTESTVFPDAFRRDTDFSFEQWALFGEAYLDLFEIVHLTAGLRYFEEDRVDTTTLSGPFAFFPGTTTLTASENGVTPKFVISIDATDDVMIYALAAEGFRSGGPNNQGGLFALAPPEFDSDSIWNFELGLKSSFMDGAIVLNGAVYYVDWTDIQVNNPVPQAFFVTNAGKAHTAGFELEMVARPTDALEIALSGGYTSAELDEDTPPGTVGGVEGARLPFVPKFTFNASADYSFSVSRNLDGSVRIDFQAVGRSVNSVNPNILETQPAYELFNIRAAIGGERWKFEVFAENLFDKRAITQSAILFSNEIFRNRPRTIGAGVRAGF
ncbi:MAG: TonB-dependent receptor [Sphingomonadales bacterium]|nr:TonB-dependent receptor [Sphingomonadales bacterium]